MSRCLVVSNQVGKEKQTAKNVRYITAYKMPSYNTKGVLWYPKNDACIVNVAVPEETMPQQFKDYANLMPGALIDVTFGVNDFTGKTFVQRFDVVNGSNVHKADTLYLKPAEK